MRKVGRGRTWVARGKLLERQAGGCGREVQGMEAVEGNAEQQGEAE